MNSTASKTLKGLSLVFFASGFCALIYQVSWQRLLFSHIGIDLSSITVIISVFMVGLGVVRISADALLTVFLQVSSPCFASLKYPSVCSVW